MLKSHIARHPHRIRQSSPRASISLRTAAQRRSRSASEGVGYSTSLRMALRPPAFVCRGRAYDIGLPPAMAARAPVKCRDVLPLIPAHSASLRAFTPVFDGLWTRVNALMAGIQGEGLGPRNEVPATRASRGAPRGDERQGA